SSKTFTQEKKGPWPLRRRVLSGTASFRRRTASPMRIKTTATLNNNSTYETAASIKLMKTNLDRRSDYGCGVLDGSCPQQLSPRIARPQPNRTPRPDRQRAGALQNLAAAFGLVLAAQSGISQTWQTVDDFQYVAGATAWASALAMLPNGT